MRTSSRVAGGLPGPRLVAEGTSARAVPVDGDDPASTECPVAVPTVARAPRFHRPLRAMDSPDPARVDAELAWMDRIRAGDAAAFEALFHAYYRPLARFAHSLLQSRAQAEETVQDVFLKLWADREELHVRESVRAFLYTLTRNRALNVSRRDVFARRWSESEEAPERVHARAEGAEERAQVAELDAAIEDAIERLPARCRETFVLSRHHHLSHEQIARVMGVSRKTVQEQMGRALRAMRASLAAWLE